MDGINVKTLVMIQVKHERGEKNKRRKGGSDNRGAGFITEIIPVSTV
jgi:microcompartment protein CcmK/EutM